MTLTLPSVEIKLCASGYLSADFSIDDLPALGQVLETPRRATPSLPPGLFPDAAKQSSPVTVAATTRVHVLPPQPHATVQELSQGVDVDARKPTMKSSNSSLALTKPEGKIDQLLERIPMIAKQGSRMASEVVHKEKSEPSIPVKKPATLASIVGGQSKAVQSIDLKQTPTRGPEITTTRRHHPGKLNIDTTPSIKDTDVTAAKSETRVSRAPSLTASLSSRPGTPLATAVNTGSPFKRTVQPRTLRITDTPKTETPPVLPAAVSAITGSTASTTPIQHNTPSKIVSRRASIVSLKEPSTPHTERTDAMSLASQSVSRASSPPPSNAVKKSKKKEKSSQKKKEKEVDDAAILTAKEATEDIGPIMARKTKSKRSKPASSVPAVAPKPTSKAIPPPIIAEEQPEEVAQAQKEHTPENPPATTVSQVDEVHPSSPTEITKITVEQSAAAPSTPPHRPLDKVKDASPKQLTAAHIFNALESTHQLAASTLNLLKPLTSQSELKKLGIDPFTSADLQNHIEQLRFELTRADEQLIKQGQALRRDLASTNDSVGRISGKCLITPNLTRLSCLTQEEESRYLELETRVSNDKSNSRWGGGISHVPRQSLKPKKKQLAATLAQEDVLRALSVATDSFEGVLRDVIKGPTKPNPQVEGHLGPALVQTGRVDSPQDPAMDAREYVNKFVPKLLDPNPNSVAVPAAEDDTDEWIAGEKGWLSRRFPLHPADMTSQIMADASAAAGLGPPMNDITLPPPPVLPNIGQQSHFSASMANSMSALNATAPVGSGSGISPAEAIAHIRDAVATATKVAKLNGNEVMRSPVEILREWDKAMAKTAGGSPKNIQSTLEQVMRQQSASDIASSNNRAADGAMSISELHNEDLSQKLAEARKESAEWEKRLNKVVRGNRKLVGLGNH